MDPYEAGSESSDYASEVDTDRLFNFLETIEEQILVSGRPLHCASPDRFSLEHFLTWLVCFDIGRRGFARREAAAPAVVLTRRHL